jgi:hypothetical protein
MLVYFFHAESGWPVVEERQMNKSSSSVSVAPAFVLGVCLAIGLILAGYFVSGAIMESRRGDRTVTVRGLAEREVRADLVVWPITFRGVGTDPAMLQERLQSNESAVRAFLSQKGFPQEQVTTRPPNTVDLEAQTFSNPGAERPFRFVGSMTVVVQSSDVDKVLEAMQSIGELLAQGVVLGGEEYGGARPDFRFTALNDIKPEMLKEANQNARQAANKFADDSATAVGAIRRASQGLFEIRDRDQNTPDIKVVRVVTTVEYFLK